MVATFAKSTFHHSSSVRELDDTYMKSFVKAHRGLVQRHIFSMVSDDSIDSDTLRISAR